MTVEGWNAAATIVIAAFTVVLAVVGGVQAWLTRQSINLTRDSIELARKEFVATHRPKLRVRRFMAHLNEGRPLMIQYLVVNIGDTDAHVRRFETQIGIQPFKKAEIQVMTDPEEPRTIKPGEACLYLTKATDVEYDPAWALQHPMAWIAIRGTIEYADDNGVERWTGFWRTRKGNGPFTKSDDPEYEYED